MKQASKIVIAFLAMCIVLVTSSQLATAQEWVFKPITEADKVWEVRFNHPLDSTSLTKDSVYVVEGKNRHATALRLTGNGYTVEVTPSTPYVKGKQYHLMITSAVKSKDGKALKTPIEVPFQLVNPDDKIQSVYSKTVNILTTVTVTTSPDVHSVKISSDEMKYEGNNTYTLTLVDAKIGSTLTIYGYDENRKRIETEKYKIE